MRIPYHIAEHLNENGVTTEQFSKWVESMAETNGVAVSKVDLDMCLKDYFEQVQQYKHTLSQEDKKEDFWTIPVSWTVVHKIYVPKCTAEDIDGACAIAKAADLPPNEIWEYCDDSFQIDVAYLDEENGIEEEGD